jgi:hypothetical protein
MVRNRRDGFCASQHSRSRAIDLRRALEVRNFRDSEAAWSERVMNPRCDDANPGLDPLLLH